MIKGNYLYRGSKDKDKDEQTNVTKNISAVGKKNNGNERNIRRSSGDIKKKQKFDLQNLKPQHQELIDRLEKYIEENAQKSARKSVDTGLTHDYLEDNFEFEKSIKITNSPPAPECKITDNQPSRKSEKKVKMRTYAPEKKITKNIDPKAEKKLCFLTTKMEKPKKGVSIQPNLNAYSDTKINKSQGGKHQFLTGSRYNGLWDNATQCMDGYGTYAYPDGSIYRGYFSRGHFNGYGTLYLAAPHNFTYKGTFVNGVLNEIEDMWFDDGLHVKATFKNWSADFRDWNYCYSKDRRFAAEQLEGLPAVGPSSFLSNTRPPRELGKNCYDVEEGFYNPSSGLIMDRPYPLTSISVPSKDHVQWIVKNCRHGSNIKQKIPDATYRQVIENNLESEILMRDHEPSCNFNQRLYNKRYFDNLCKEDVKAHLEAKISDESVVYRSPNSSSSCASLSDRSVLLDIAEHVETTRLYEQLKLGRDLEREQSKIVADAAQLAARRLQREQ